MLFPSSSCRGVRVCAVPGLGLADLRGECVLRCAVERALVNLGTKIVWLLVQLVLCGAYTALAFSSTLLTPAELIFESYYASV